MEMLQQQQRVQNSKGIVDGSHLKAYALELMEPGGRTSEAGGGRQGALEGHQAGGEGEGHQVGGEGEGHQGGGGGEGHQSVLREGRRDKRWA